MQWCKFVVDQLHDELSKGKFTQACLFHLQVFFNLLSVFSSWLFLPFVRLHVLVILYQLLYVDSVDVSGLELLLPEGRFAVNIWSNELINVVMDADLQLDGKSYGKLEVIVASTFFIVDNLHTYWWITIIFLCG
jgi:hypothetical protein